MGRSIDTAIGEQFEASSLVEVVHIQPASILLCVCPLEQHCSTALLVVTEIVFSEEQNGSH